MSDEIMHHLAALGAQRRAEGKVSLEAERILQGLEDRARREGHASYFMDLERAIMVARRWGRVWFALVCAIGVYRIDRAEALLYLENAL